jgi:hypothetical protein
VGRASATAVPEDAAEQETGSSPGWLPLVVLASAQFVMVLDSSVMNVSISQIVADLDATSRAFSWRSRRTRSLWPR